ncbi:MAG: DUF6247 family protein [Pseudonocardiaceae bacterium]
MPAAAHLPESHCASAEDSAVGGLEPSPEWVGDAIAAARFRSPEAIRAALLPEQVGEFDTAFDAALHGGPADAAPGLAAPCAAHVATDGVDDRAGPRWPPANAGHCH